MKVPHLVDICSGLGGATRGYQRAGFRVTGVDIVAQPDYCGDEFVQGDGLAFLIEHWREFDAIHTSFPCQASAGPTKGTNAARNVASGRRHLDLNPAGRALLDAIGLPYVMEGVPGSVLRPDLVLCGEMSGLRVIRHRKFELGGWTMAQPQHRPHRGRVAGWRHGQRFEGPYYAVYGRRETRGGQGGGKATTAQCREGLGIDWSWDRSQLVEAIPPAYTELVGGGLMAHLMASGRWAA